MKRYKFKATNWKNIYSKSFFFYRAFPSAYWADYWASRFIRNPLSPYIVTLQAGEEIQ